MIVLEELSIQVRSGFVVEEVHAFDLAQGIIVLLAEAQAMSIMLLRYVFLTSTVIYCYA